MPAEKQTKKQRIEEAREAARIARERREKRARMMKVLIPTLVSVGVLAIVAIVIVVIAIQPKPAAALPGGPKNMASDGIVFEQTGGTAKYVATAALKKGEKPKATDWSSDQDTPHLVTYIDLTCPVCKQFEATYSSTIKKLVADGKATLEVKPVAILQQNYTTDYSDRAANVAACVANYEPAKFLDALTVLYDNQAAEQSAGLTNEKMISLLHSKGITNDSMDACIRGDSYKSWVTAATARATSDDALKDPSSGGFGTPTITVNGTRWDGTGDFETFVTSGGTTTTAG